jgi:hypothetical protein
MPVALLEKRLDDARCREDPTAAEACVLALSVLAFHADPPRAIDWRATPPALAAPPEDMPRGAGFDDRFARERGAVRAWRARRGQDEVSFAALFRALRPVAEATPGGARITAEAVRAYLRRREDPHTELAPYPAVAEALHHRQGGSLLSFTMQYPERRESASFSRVYHAGKVFGAVRLDDLDDIACGNISYALLELERDGAEGWLLDLRGNLGGVASEADCVLDLFLEQDTALYRLEPLAAGAPRRAFRARGKALTKLPLVVLTDARTASGAELIAAVLQARRRGVVVEDRSFGKGTYQRASAWPEREDVVLYRTISRIVVEPGYEFQMHGVMPDLTVEGDAGAWREATAYVNPIRAAHPPVPTRRFAWNDACPRESISAERPAEDPVLEAAKRFLACKLR